MKRTLLATAFALTLAVALPLRAQTSCDIIGSTLPLLLYLGAILAAGRG